MVAQLDIKLSQIDVNTAFLNDNLEEEIYMDQSILFVSQRTIYIVSGRSASEHLRAMSAMVRDLKAVGRDVFEEK